MTPSFLRTFDFDFGALEDCERKVRAAIQRAPVLNVMIDDQKKKVTNNAQTIISIFSPQFTESSIFKYCGGIIL
jgi:hypothetical protein